MGKRKINRFVASPEKENPMDFILRTSPLPPFCSLSDQVKIRNRTYVDELARFVAETQLMNAHLWERFAAQFTEQIDGSNLGWRGEYWGKMMRGGCLAYQYLKKRALYNTLSDAVEKMLEIQEEDGRISSYDRNTEFDAWDLWCRKYVMLGMEYFLQICHLKKLSKRIVKSLERQADAIIAKIGPEEGQIDIRTATRHWGGLNSCSILEPFVRLYGLTLNKRYLDFADYIISTGFCADGNIIDLVKEGISPYQFPQVKAYEMMSCFEGLAEYAILTGRRDILNLVCKFAKSIAETDVTIIGSCGCTHELFDHSGVKQTEYSEGIMQETCVTVTWMKLCYLLLRYTGDAFFADQIERSALNALSGAVNLQRNQKGGGLTFDSYSPLVASRRGKAVGGQQTISDDGEFYGCCACIGAAGVAIANLYGFMVNEKGIVISNYQSSKISFETPQGQKAVLSIVSSLPTSGKVLLKLDMEHEEHFTISLRIPAWSRKTEIRVGDRPRMAGEPGTFFTQSFCFHGGDVIKILLDNATRVTYLNDKMAIYKGGTVFAADERLDAQYDKAVKIKIGASARVPFRMVEPTIPVRQQMEILCDDGDILHLVDYASAGNVWDEDECGVNVWIAPKA